MTTNTFLPNGWIINESVTEEEGKHFNRVSYTLLDEKENRLFQTSLRSEMAQYIKENYS